MNISMHSATVATFTRIFGAMLVWLDRAQDHAATRGFSPDNYCSLRFAPDMLPLTNQVQIACDMAKACAARLAGEPVPSWPDDETTLDELRARIERTREYVAGFGPERIDGTGDKAIEVPRRDGTVLRFSGSDYVTQYALPHFWFHATTLYDLLRQAGVVLGKKDFLALPPQH